MDCKKAILAHFDSRTLELLQNGQEMEIDTNDFNTMSLTMPNANIQLQVQKDVPDSAIYSSVDSQNLRYVGRAWQANVSSVQYKKEEKVPKQVDKSLHDDHRQVPSLTEGSRSGGATDVKTAKKPVPPPPVSTPQRKDKGKGKEVAPAPIEPVSVYRIPATPRKDKGKGKEFASPIETAPGSSYRNPGLPAATPQRRDKGKGKEVAPPIETAPGPSYRNPGLPTATPPRRDKGKGKEEAPPMDTTPGPSYRNPGLPTATPQRRDKGKGKEVAPLMDTTPGPSHRNPGLPATPRSQTSGLPVPKSSPRTRTPPAVNIYMKKPAAKSPAGVHKKASSASTPIKKAPSPASKKVASHVPTEAKYPLHTRIMQRIALRPSSVSTLVNYLSRNQARKVNSIDVTNIVTACGIEITANDRRKYCLKPQYYPEIMVDDWPFYNEEDRDIVRYNIEEAAILLQEASKKQKRELEERTSSPRVKKQKQSPPARCPTPPLKRSSARPGTAHRKPTPVMPPAASTTPTTRPSPTAVSTTPKTRPSPTAASTTPRTRPSPPAASSTPKTRPSPSVASVRSLLAKTHAAVTPSPPQHNFYQPESIRITLIGSQERFIHYCRRHNAMQRRYLKLKHILKTKYPTFMNILATTLPPTRATSYQNLLEQYREMLKSAYKDSDKDSDKHFDTIEAIASELLKTRDRLNYLWKSLSLSVKMYNYTIPQ
ncbi:hypothetical protein BDF20DRAFT_836357 [Mycotypha africana]|uniref:uncharacterized protein n=1 Tax=Mycotypha africana TaxID=64632 RepID=UPI002301ADCF|nr:uncharacterized protein BDF20DRAFT_836357 [Mycotypha africana]KAI8977573.1 hypothetical protein BDF20DRAFT_836357 [Mycotypha africana]